MKVALILVGVCVLALVVDAVPWPRDSVQADNDWPYDGNDGRTIMLF